MCKRFCIVKAKISRKGGIDAVCFEKSRYSHHAIVIHPTTLPCRYSDISGVQETGFRPSAA